MIIVIADDEALALKATVNAVREALPGADIHDFIRWSALLEFAETNSVDVAFLDIHMRGITGLALAEKLKALNPRINIIFVTGYDEYKADAMDLHASGYLMKPIVAADIKEEMRFLRYPVAERKPVIVKCFGHFHIQINGVQPHFTYSRTEELFAYLIDRRGAAVSYGELSAILWEDESHLPYLKRLRADLLHTFREAGCPDVILSKRGTLSVDLDKIDCDYLDYLNRIPGSEGSFYGEYMKQYSWAEETLGYLLGNRF